MSTPKSKKKEAAKNWKNLAPKSSSRNPASKAAFRKRANTFMRIFVLILVLAGVGVGIWWFEEKINSSDYPLELTGPGVPVSKTIFQSDGVLTSNWFSNWFGPLRGRSLMQIDIHQLRTELENEPQIASARVTRKFPSTLEISIREMHPILVLRMRSEGGGIQDWLVSDNGTLYQGSGYARTALASLPSLSVNPNSIIPRKDGNGFLKIAGISEVAPLLELARSEYPAIYRNWQVVSFERPHEDDPGAHILVNSRKVRSIRFSPKDFSSQMTRLHYLLTEPDFRRKPIVESIDLSHGRSVYAKL